MRLKRNLRESASRSSHFDVDELRCSFVYVLDSNRGMEINIIPQKLTALVVS